MHSPKSRGIFIPKASRARPNGGPHGYGPRSQVYEQLALGCLAVLRKEDGALIGRCGLTDFAVEAAAPEHRMRQGWFGREAATTGVALTFEPELSYTFDPAAWGNGLATEAARCVRDYARDVLGLAYAVSAILPAIPVRARSPNDLVRERTAKWK